MLQLLLRSLHLIDLRLLIRPTRLQLTELLALIRQLLAQIRQTLLRRLVGLLLQRDLLDLKPAHNTLQLINLLRRRIDLHSQTRARLINQVNRLIRQESVRDVTVRQLCSRHQRRILDPHAVVHLVALLQASQDTDRVLHSRLAHVHLLETTLQRRILLNELAVLIERRRTNQPKLAARQHRLNHVARIHRALARRTSTNDGVELVNKRDDLPVGLLNLVQHRLQALLELATVLRARNHRPEVQGDQRLTLQRLWDVARHDAPCKALDDRRLTDARLTNQHRIILRTTGKHLHHASNLRIATNDRVNLALARTRRQVRRILLQRLELILRRLSGDLLIAANRLERRLNRLKRSAALLQQLRRVIIPARDTRQQHLSRDELVAEFARQLLRRVQRIQAVTVKVRIRHILALRLRVGVDQLSRLLRDRLRVHTRRLQHRRRDAVLLLQDRLK